MIARLHFYFLRRELARQRAWRDDKPRRDAIIAARTRNA